MARPRGRGTRRRRSCWGGVSRSARRGNDPHRRRHLDSQRGLKVRSGFSASEDFCRNYWGGKFGDKVQDWPYIAGEFTGDAWAIRRSDGSDDQVVLSDYRVILGMERKIGRGEFAIRDRLRFRPADPLSQRPARLPSDGHGDAARRIDVLRNYLKRANLVVPSPFGRGLG